MCWVYSLYTYADMHTSVFDALLWDVKRCRVRSVLVLVIGIIESCVSSSQSFLVSPISLYNFLNVT